MGGAAELDMVINIGALKVTAIRDRPERHRCRGETMHTPSAAIVEGDRSRPHTRRTKKGRRPALSGQGGGRDYVKTSTGFGPSGATVGDVALMRRWSGPESGVKARPGHQESADDVKSDGGRRD